MNFNYFSNNIIYNYYCYLKLDNIYNFSITNTYLHEKFKNYNYHKIINLKFEERKVASRYRNLKFKMDLYGHPITSYYINYSDKHRRNFSMDELKYLYSLSLKECNWIIDVSMFKNIHTLNLSYCICIKDISILKNLHILNISKCDIKDVSALGNLHTLIMRYCHKIEDVSALGKLHTLDLLGCSKIKDVSALGNLYSLNLKFTKVEDVSMLNNLSYLNISYCNNIKDISKLKNIKKLIYGEI